MPKILAYDPDPEAEWHALTESGHEVFPFHDQGEALDFAQEKKIDIAILSAPEGIDLIKHLREISPNYKVILISGSPSVTEVRRSLAWAPCSYLFKPVVREEMEACLKRALLKGKATIKTALNLNPDN
jgi:two-component SAPR family response regulator